MANHLEATAWDRSANTPNAVVQGLPYVRVETADGEFITSSRLESHRLASAFVKDAELDGVDMITVIRDRLALRDDRQIQARDIARAVFALDPFCLLHGVFFAHKNWLGQPKIARAVTGFVEATDVRRAESGGVKRDEVRHSIGDTGGSEEGYGSIPFSRTEWTAQEITASFAVDFSQIRAYGLGDAATQLLESIALWEIATLLEGEMRLRTACDLVPIEIPVVDTNGVALESPQALAHTINGLIGQCGNLLPDGGEPITVTWAPKTKGKKATKGDE
jgi:CRISPR-associated protein Csb1